MPDLFESPGRYIMRISSGILHCLDSFVEGTSMTPAEARVLQFIAAANAPLCQKDIEAEYGLSAATVSELIQGMENKGLIRRETDPEDRRRKRLMIDDAILGQVRAMREKMIRMEAELIRGIEPEEQALLMRMLRRMTGNMPPKGA